MTHRGPNILFCVYDDTSQATCRMSECTQIIKRMSMNRVYMMMVRCCLVTYATAFLSLPLALALVLAPSAFCELMPFTATATVRNIPQIYATSCCTFHSQRLTSL